MAFRRIGISLSQRRLVGRQELAEGLRELETASPDFVEVAPHGLGVILGGRLNEDRTAEVKEVLAAAGHAYTVHAAHALDLMDLDTHGLQRDAFKEIGEVTGGLGVTIAVEHSYPEPPIVAGRPMCMRPGPPGSPGRWPGGSPRRRDLPRCRPRGGGGELLRLRLP